jgi:peptide-methionine (R)-S-oxide reductase
MASVGAVAIAIAGHRALTGPTADVPDANLPIRHTDAEWRVRLSPASYKVLRQGDTEVPGSSALVGEHRKGTFACAGCDQPLFASSTKFDSHTGWPSFWDTLPNATTRRLDLTIARPRTEVRCSSCGGHLGHVFDDGPRPTGLRYCMNGVALVFHPANA